MDEISDKLEVTIDDKPREMFMSFGLLSHISAIVGDPSRVPMMSLDADMRTEVLKALLAERKKSGKIIKTIEDIGDLDVSVDDMEKIIDWASEHVMSFIVRSAQRAVRVTKKHEAQLTALVSSSNGLVASISETA